MRVFENRVLGGGGEIFVKMVEETGEWGKLCHVELHKLYGSPDVIKVNISGRMR
jgi:hypothetical protein